MTSESDERTEKAEERTELAEERTKWADQRTFLAQERTFAGWIRTGLASMAVGLGIIEIMREVEPTWLITAIGLILITVGGLLVGLAFFSYRKVTMQLKDSRQPDMAIPIWWIGVIAAALAIVAIGGIGIVFL